MEHTKVYAEIEMVRFPKIKVEYDIQDENFYIPVLTIQPLVENSIRHGIRGLENGKVTVSTRRTPDYHEIIVKDNGKGFDAKKIKQKDSGHIRTSGQPMVIRSSTDLISFLTLLPTL